MQGNGHAEDTEGRKGSWEECRLPLPLCQPRGLHARFRSNTEDLGTSLTGQGEGAWEISGDVSDTTILKVLFIKETWPCVNVSECAQRALSYGTHPPWILDGLLWPDNVLLEGGKRQPCRRNKRALTRARGQLNVCRWCFPSTSATYTSHMPWCSLRPGCSQNYHPERTNRLIPHSSELRR